MTRIEWIDLSDSELRLRLESRGLWPWTAYWLTRRRDWPNEAVVIERIMRP